MNVSDEAIAANGNIVKVQFDSPYNIPQGSTTNYMDYSYPNMYHFWKEQWKTINPKKFKDL